MTKLIPVKPLPKLIKTIINIRIRTWHDKYYGNTYSSARATVNNDYANEIVVPRRLNTANQMECDVLKQIAATFKGLSQLNAGIYISVSVIAGTKRDCKLFGER